MEQQIVAAPLRHRSVDVYQVAKHIWIADGKVLGNQLRVRGSTSRKALIAWRKAAVERTRTIACRSSDEK